MVTGLYPHQHGVTGNDPELPDQSVKAMQGRSDPKLARYYEAVVNSFASRPNLVRDLTAKGYQSFQTGKWWEGDPVKTAGFSHAMTVGTGKGDRHGGAGLAIGREGLAPIRDFIEGVGDKPFLVWYAPMLPHAPHTPPDELLQKYLKLTPSKPMAAYWASVEWFDRTCGELLDLLAEKKLREDTIIVYVCDNGWLQNPAKPNIFAERSKLSPYEGGVRTPIMISWPAKLKPRMDDEHLASTIDLWPTLAALLKTDAPKDLPGIDLTDADAVAKRSRIFGEQYTHNIAEVGHPEKSLQHRWVIDGWWKLVVTDSGSGKPQLYDLKNDPWEKNDISTAQPERVGALTGKLHEWWQPAERN